MVLGPVTSGGRSMPWPRNSDALEIKARVRRRDGNRCVVCTLDEVHHEKQRGRILDVHRIVPGSRYSTDFGLCATVCEICHGAIHGNGHGGWITTKNLDNEWQIQFSTNQSSRVALSGMAAGSGTILYSTIWR